MLKPKFYWDKLITGMCSLVATFVFCFLAPVVNADEAFSNIQKGGLVNFSVSIGNVDGESNRHIAAQFVSARPGRLSRIEIPLSLGSFSDSTLDSVEVTVWNNCEKKVGGQIIQTPGDALWSGQIQVESGGGIEVYSIQLDNVAQPMLRAKQTYWLSARAANGVNRYQWSHFFNNDDLILVQSDNAGGENWSQNTSKTLMIPRFSVCVDGNVCDGTLVELSDDCYFLEMRLAFANEFGGLVAFGLEDLGNGDILVSYQGIAQLISIFEVEPGIVFDANYVLNNIPLAINDNSVNNTIVHLELGESLFVAHWDDGIPSYGNDRPDSGDGFGWAEIKRYSSGLILVDCASFDSLGIVVGTEIQAPEPILGDANQDGAVDLLDVQAFVDLLSSGEILIEADVNNDGSVNLLDVGPFVDLITGI